MPYLDVDFLQCIRHRSLQGYYFLPPDTVWRLVWIWGVILDDEGEGFILLISFMNSMRLSTVSIMVIFDQLFISMHDGCMVRL